MRKFYVERASYLASDKRDEKYIGMAPAQDCKIDVDGRWYVELTTLEDLLNFCMYEEIILSWGEHGEFNILIYNDRIEW